MKNSCAFVYVLILLKTCTQGIGLNIKQFTLKVNSTKNEKNKSHGFPFVEEFIEDQLTCFQCNTIQNYDQSDQQK